MRFLADESCDFAVVRALEAAGHDVKTVAHLAPGAPDIDVVEMAHRESRILLTEDKDFGQLFFASAPASPGVVLLRFPARARKTMVDAVMTLITDHHDRLPRRFAVVRPGRVQIISKALNSAERTVQRHQVRPTNPGRAAMDGSQCPGRVHICGLSDASSVLRSDPMPRAQRPSDVIDVLITAIDRAFDKKSWHGTNLMGSVRGLTAREALWRPARGRHNVWEILIHAAYWKYVVRR